MKRQDQSSQPLEAKQQLAWGTSTEAQELQRMCSQLHHFPSRSNLARPDLDLPRRYDLQTSIFCRIKQAQGLPRRPRQLREE